MNCEQLYRVALGILDGKAGPNLVGFLVSIYVHEFMYY